MSHILKAGKTLRAGKNLVSPNGCHKLAVQTDGNLVLYSLGSAIWNTGTVGHQGTELVMQTDGNLVLYKKGGIAIWHSSTFGNGPSDLHLQSDRNLVVYDNNGRATWATMTNTDPKYFKKVKFEAPLGRIDSIKLAMPKSYQYLVETYVACSQPGVTVVSCTAIAIVLATLMEFDTGKPFGENNEIRVLGKQLDKSVRGAGGDIAREMKNLGGSASDLFKDMGGAISSAGGALSDGFKKIFG